MSKELVKITQEQADAIETMKAKGSSLVEIVEHHYEKELTKVNGWEFVATLSTDTVIRALYIGYVVEVTLGDKVRELFEKAEREEEFAIKAKDRARAEYWSGVQLGIVETINALNINIEGVNQ